SSPDPLGGRIEPCSSDLVPGRAHRCRHRPMCDRQPPEGGGRPGDAGGESRTGPARGQWAATLRVDAVSVTAAKGFVAGGTACGIKASGDLDLALVDAGRPVPAAAVFTSNTAAAAPVTLSRRNLEDGTARAVVLNSGCANAATGRAGEVAAFETAAAASELLGCQAADVVVCSTGPIGSVVPLERIRDGLARIAIDSEGAESAALAILT